MPAILTTGSQVVCEHGGTVILKSLQAKLKVNGKPALLQSDLPGSTITGCPTPSNANPPTKPCTSVTSVIAGTASRLAINGTPVLTANAIGMTDGVAAKGPGQWNVRSAGQTKLVAS